jgi:hypothetical protein
MDRMTFVTVYRFEVWNPEIRSFIPSLRMGTRAAIAAVPGEIIRGSAVEIAITELDADGFTKPDLGN